MGRFNYFIGNDIEIEIYALDFFDLLQTLSYCFKALIIDEGSNKNLTSKIISLDISNDFFPIDYINELIYLFDSQSFVPNNVKILNNKNFSVEVIGFYILEKDKVKRILKAATYHQYQFTKNEYGNFYVKMIIDI